MVYCLDIVIDFRLNIYSHAQSTYIVYHFDVIVIADKPKCMFINFVLDRGHLFKSVKVIVDNHEQPNVRTFSYNEIHVFYAYGPYDVKKILMSQRSLLMNIAREKMY